MISFGYASFHRKAKQSKNRQNACVCSGSLQWGGRTVVGWIAADACVVSGTLGIRAIYLVIAVVIDAIVADFGLAYDIVCTLGIVAVCLVVAIVVDSVAADFGLTNLCFAAFWIVAVYPVVAIVVDAIVADFGQTN